MAGKLGAKGQARRADVLAAAHGALVTEGLDRFVLRDIAARAGMTLGNLQYYFPSRGDLLEAVVRAEFARNLDAVRAAADGPDLDRLADDLLAQWYGEGGAVFATLWLLARHEDRFAALYRDVYQAFYAELAPALRRLDPGADDGEVLRRSRVITALLDGLSLQGLGAPAPGPADAEVLAAAKALVLDVATGRC